MLFDANEKKPKATLKIGDKEFKIYSPTIQQSDAYDKELTELKGSDIKVFDLMVKYICMLGDIPEADIKALQQDMFLDLFKYVIYSEKKS